MAPTREPGPEGTACNPSELRYGAALGGVPTWHSPPEQRRSRARLAAFVQWSKTDDWTTRTQAARRAYYVDLGRRSGKARSAKKGGGEDAA